jgi:hypothetical protein
MVRLVRLCLALAAISMASCSKAASDLPEGKPVQRHGEHTAISEQTAGSCRELAERFQRVLDQASGTCSASTDCGCYNPVSARAGCGGVTDAKAAAKLAEIEREFHAQDCPWPRQCAPWACAPRCASGRCTR